MKHIEKKFLLQEKHSEEKLESFNKTHKTVEKIERFTDKELDEIYRKGILFSFTTNGYTFPLLRQKIDKKKYLIPMPDPTLIYFNNAQTSYRHINEFKENLKEKLKIESLMEESCVEEIYNYFGITSQFVIFLFTSMESFVNQMIPKDFEYKKISSHKTEIYNAEQIQKHLSFNEKLKKVLPKCTEKNFFFKQTPTTQHIDNLKDFRDEIVHTKKDTKNSTLFYDSLVTKSLNFKYEETIRAVQSFMNFYKPDYVVECNCGKDI